MKLLHRVSNSVEAHMVLDLLEQAGIRGHIEGEHLQGLEKLELGGFLRIVVDDEEYEIAKDIINSIEPSEHLTKKQSPNPERNYFFRYVMIGFVSGSIFVALIYYIPIVVEKYDLNSDGTPDGKSVYFDNRISRTELDRNFDGKVDFVFKYNTKGFVKTIKSDDNFDGVFETNTKYLHGNPSWSKSDTTGDGFQDYHMKFENGIIETITFVNPDTKKPTKIQNYIGPKLVSAELDTNGDGILNRSYEYNEIEEIIKTKEQ